MKGRSLSRRQVMRQLSCAAGVVTLGASGLGWALRDALAEENAPWSYADPAQWPHLAPACGGTRQSPVDLGTAAPAEAEALAFNWSPFAADLAHNGHTLQVAPRAGAAAGSITLGNTRFDFLQFHFHHPSEHAVAGKRWPLEVHLVHKIAEADTAEARLAVIGILFRPGRENDVLAGMLKALPRAGQQKQIADPIDLTGLLPANAATFFYQGSLTTPPCSEVVSWIVFRDPIEAGIGQIERLKQAMPVNARPLQPSAGRSLGLDLF